MITAALICYYGMGWGFVEICEFFSVTIGAVY